MELAQATFIVFVTFSSVRIFSYVPQIYRVARDPNGASAISYATWGLWTAANAATALYAVVNLQDRWLATVSVLYATCCLSVITLTWLKREQPLRTVRRGLFARVHVTAQRRVALVNRVAHASSAQAKKVLCGTQGHGISDLEMRELCTRLFFCEAALLTLRGLCQVLSWTSGRRPSRTMPNNDGASAVPSGCTPPPRI